MNDTIQRPQRPRRARAAKPAVRAPNQITEAPAASINPVAIEADALPPGYEPPPNDDGPTRRSRVPFASNKLRLEYSQRPGFTRRWFNDTPGRIQRARDADWDHVRDEQTGKPVCTVAGVAREGGGLTSYLMEIPTSLYEQDQAAKQRLIDEFDDDLRRGQSTKTQPGEDGRYVPMKPDGTPRIELRTGQR